MQQAIDYEVQWQIDTIEGGGKIQQATVLFNPDTGQTRAMRSKEEAHDYRYFPDPDLLPLAITPEMIDEVSSAMPELPEARRTRYMDRYALTSYDASMLTSSREMADYFDACVSLAGPENAKLAANWIIGEVSAQLNREDLEIAQCPVSPKQLGGMLVRIADGTISNSGAKEVFRMLWSEGGDADAIIEAKGLKQVSDAGAIEALVDGILAANADKVAEYRSGKEKLFGFFVGLAMKASKGKANPAQLNEILQKKLVG